LWALENKDINGILYIMGGDHSYRVFPFIDINVIHGNPKVFMGYSDIASWTTLFAVAGVMSYYGPNLLTPIAQPIKLDDYTMQAIENAYLAKIKLEKLSHVIPIPILNGEMYPKTTLYGPKILVIKYFKGKEKPKEDYLVVVEPQ